MSNDFPELVPHAMAASIGITFFPESADPVIVLTYHLDDGGVLRIGMSADEMESMIPTQLGAIVRARVITEMITLYPEKRDEILQNILFRWTGELGEAGDG